MLHFIERYFGVFPDDGYGSIEVLSFLALITLFVVVGLRMSMELHPGKIARSQHQQGPQSDAADAAVRDPQDERSPPMTPREDQQALDADAPLGDVLQWKPDPVVGPDLARTEAGSLKRDVELGRKAEQSAKLFDG